MGAAVHRFAWQASMLLGKLTCSGYIWPHQAVDFSGSMRSLPHVFRRSMLSNAGQSAAIISIENMACCRFF
jgi:hypothetical protein